MGPCFVLNTIALANIYHGESVSSDLGLSNMGTEIECLGNEYRPRQQSLSSQFGVSFGWYHVCRSHCELLCLDLPNLSICPSRTSYEASTGNRGWSIDGEVYSGKKRGKRPPAEYQARHRKTGIAAGAGTEVWTAQGKDSFYSGRRDIFRLNQCFWPGTGRKSTEW